MAQPPAPSPSRSPSRSQGRSQGRTSRLVRAALAIACAVALSGCVVYPVGGYGRPYPGYYYGGGYGYYGHPGWR